MKSFLLALLCVGNAEVIQRTPIKSLGEVLFAKHPTGMGKKNGAVRQNHPAMLEPGEGPQMQKVQRAFMPKDKKVSVDEIKKMAGVSAPIGYWDPLQLMKKADERKVSFVREVELKQGRLAMLAALGFAVSEVFHPFGAYRGCGEGLAFPCKPDEVAAASVLLQGPTGGNGWAITTLMQFGTIFEFVLFYLFYFSRSQPSDWKPGHEPGKFPTNGFDPLSLKPRDPVKLKEMQTKELNNGRLAMLAITGMIAQEAVTMKPVFR